MTKTLHQLYIWHQNRIVPECLHGRNLETCSKREIGSLLNTRDLSEVHGPQTCSKCHLDPRRSGSKSLDFQRWTMHERRDLACAELNDAIYVAGGFRPFGASTASKPQSFTTKKITVTDLEPSPAEVGLFRLQLRLCKHDRWGSESHSVI
jgi:hypothetical protein